MGDDTIIVKETRQAKHNPERRLVWAALGVTLLILLAACGGGAAPGGEAAPDLALATTEGEFLLSERQGEVSLLYFSFPAWPTCALEAPALARLQSEYKDRGLAVLAMNIWPSRYSLEEWVSFWKRIGADEVVWAQDANDTAIRDYELTALGTEVVVDREGAVVFRSEGAAGYKELSAAIEKALWKTGNPSAEYFAGFGAAPKILKTRPV